MNIDHAVGLARSSVALALLMLAGPSAPPWTLRAQTANPGPLLSVPTASRLRCRVIAPSSKGSAQGARSHMQIEEVRRLGSGTRTDDVWFDSTGKAVSMTELLTTVNGDGGANVDGIAAVLVPDGRVLGSHSRYDGAPVGAKEVIRSHHTDQLTEQEGRAIHVLTDWFWSHRCHRLDPPTTGTRGG